MSSDPNETKRQLGQCAAARPSWRDAASNEAALTAGSPAPLDEADLGVGQWVYDNGEPAGRGTNTPPSASCLFLPLRTPRGIVCILGIRPKPGLVHRFLSAEQMRLLETFGSLLALAQERIRSASEP